MKNIPAKSTVLIICLFYFIVSIIMSATIIEEEKPDDFIIYMFGSEPKPKDSIQLECPDIPPGKQTHLHIFEQLLKESA